MIPKTHPRYESLKKREKLVAGLEAGIAGKPGLIAHGRGEAFDYLIGERTLPSAMRATEAAAALLLSAKEPVISVNGNVAALASQEVIVISRLLNALLEVNIFYRTEERVKRIKALLEGQGATIVLGDRPDARIPGLAHARALVSSKGIYRADVVLAPLEDGDRCEALLRMGKKVITIDLNPLSRTSQYATISIVDDIERAMKNLIAVIKALKGTENEKLTALVGNFDNTKNIKEVVREIVNRLKEEEILEFESE